MTSAKEQMKEIIDSMDLALEECKDEHFNKQMILSYLHSLRNNVAYHYEGIPDKSQVSQQAMQMAIDSKVCSNRTDLIALAKDIEYLITQ